MLSLQILVNGAREMNEPGIFVAFEEDSVQVCANASSFGWDIPGLRRRKVSFLDVSLRPDTVRAGAFDLTALLAALTFRVKELGARRIVFDGVDVLLMLLDDPAAERAELYRIHEWVKRHELTGIVTAKADGTEPFAQARYAFAAYMADLAMLLVRRHQNVVSERDVSILKYRGSSFSENKTPFVIGPTGMVVAEQSATVGAVRARTERLTTGIPRLDTMLSGGYLRAASVLLTGLPGTAKSTLCGAFVHAACRRKERTLYVSFDEDGGETVRNLASVGIRVQSFVDSGLLEMMSALSLTDSAEVLLMRIRAAIREQRATCVVIDPISAFAKASDTAMAVGVLARFIRWSKVNGITLLCTSLLTSADPQMEATALGASTLCDTWIHLAYAQRGGERNRSLTIVKSRGTGHSNQVRELLLSDEGVSLADVYESGGEVFMGAMRWQQENAEQDEERRLRREAARKRLELERAQSETKARSEAVQRDLALIQFELENAKSIEAERVARDTGRHRELLSQRRADEGTAKRVRSPGPRSKRRNP